MKIPKNAINYYLLIHFDFKHFSGIAYNKDLDALHYIKDGKNHREDGPAVISSFNGRKEWWLNGKCHREDGPAVIESDGTRYYYKNGLLHRDDGPAVIFPGGYKAYYLNGLLHRENGPAVIESDGRKYYYINGKNIICNISIIKNSKKFRINGNKIEQEQEYE